jgi:hypothetical protein
MLCRHAGESLPGWHPTDFRTHPRLRTEHRCRPLGHSAARTGPPDQPGSHALLH